MGKNFRAFIYNYLNPNAIQTQVLNLVEGVYQFELKVTDSSGLFSSDTIVVTVNNTSCDNSIRHKVNAQLIPFGNLSIPRNDGMAIASAGNKILFAGGMDNSGTFFQGGYL